jgi:DNA mismatch endonuclease, patch repair protein
MDSIMPDIFSKEKRSKIMSEVSGKNTKIEMKIRKIIHKMGYRYRLHVRKLPGCPDIVMHKHKKVIFVNGCFWHGHQGCERSRRPTSNTVFWNRKIEGNILRDKIIIEKLKEMRWDVLVIWQCQIGDQELVEKTLRSFIERKS